VLTNDTDADGDSLTAALVNGPAHGTLSVNANGFLTYAPTTGYSGSDSFTYKANDGTADSNVATVSLTVVNHAPVAGNATYTMDKNNTLTVSTPGLLTNCTDADGDSLTTALVNGPAHGTLSLNANGSFTYTPTTGYSGNDSFTYKANDGTADSNAATVSLTILNNVSNQVSVTESGFARNRATGIWTATMTVTNTSDSAITGPIQVLLTNLTQGVTMTNNTGTYQNSPYITVTLENLAPGAYASLYIQFTNPSGGYITFTPVTYSGGLASVNHAPVATNDTYSTNKNKPLTVFATC
jgi:VCBS repeat-containing protein